MIESGGPLRVPSPASGALPCIAFASRREAGEVEDASQPVPEGQ